MYVIETEEGRFEADTERDAKKLRRAAQKKQAAIDADDNRKYTLARLKATQVGYGLYERKGRGETMPRGFRYKLVTEDTYPARRSCGDGRRIYHIDTGDSSGRVAPYDEIVGYIENGAGFCIAIAIAEQDCELFAVGACEETVVWVPLYGISITEFKTTD